MDEVLEEIAELKTLADAEAFLRKRGVPGRSAVGAVSRVKAIHKDREQRAREFVTRLRKEFGIR